MDPSRPVRIAISDDYEVVVKGLAQMLRPFRDQIEVVELTAGVPPTEDVDVVLYDTFAQAQGTELDVAGILADCGARALVIYSWNPDPQLVASSLGSGASAYLTKGLSAEELVDSLQRIGRGEQIVPQRAEAVEVETGDWPGRHEGLSERESEIIALITQGLSNDDVASRAFLSINTVKSYIRSAYRKMGATSRSQAVLWGVAHGFRPDKVRVRHPYDDD